MTEAKSFMNPTLALTQWASDPTILALPKSAAADLP